MLDESSRDFGRRIERFVRQEGTAHEKFRTVRTEKRHNPATGPS